MARLARLPSPTVAAVAAVLSVQMTTHLSLRAGVTRGLGVLGGLLVATLADRALGPGVVAVAAMTLIGLLGGRALGMSDDVARGVAATGVGMALSLSSLSAGGLVHYAAATLIGVVVGALASALVHRDPTIERAARALAELAGAMAEDLATWSVGVSNGYDAASAARWLGEARERASSTDAAMALVESAESHARFALSGDERDVSDLRAAAVALRLATGQMTGIARTLFDHAERGDLGDVTGLAVALAAAGRALARRSSALAAGEAQPPSGAIGEARSSARRVAEGIREVSDVATLVAAGSILADLARLLDQLDHDAPALEVPTPGRAGARRGWRSR